MCWKYEADQEQRPNESPQRSAEWSGVPLIPANPPLVARVFRPVRLAIEALRREGKDPR